MIDFDYPSSTMEIRIVSSLSVIDIRLSIFEVPVPFGQLEVGWAFRMFWWNEIVIRSEMVIDGNAHEFLGMTQNLVLWSNA